jgi:hypothetical protein
MVSERWTRFVRWMMQTPEAGRAKRYTLPGLVAYHWTGGDAHGCEIGDISTTGMYLVTDERWFVGTVMLMTLQRPVTHGSKPTPPDAAPSPGPVSRNPRDHLSGNVASHLAEEISGRTSGRVSVRGKTVEPASASGPESSPKPASASAAFNSVSMLAKVVRFDDEGVGLTFVFPEDSEVKLSPIHPEGGADQQALEDFLVREKVLPPPPDPEAAKPAARTIDRP